MPKASSSRKAGQAKHDPLAIQLRAGELADTGTLSAPGKRQKVKKHQEEKVRVPSALPDCPLKELTGH
jgi:hypothetical protein